MSARTGFERDLARWLRGARRVAIVGVGDELQPHDRLGMLAAKELEALRLTGVRVFLAGTVPESLTAPIRRYRPDRVLFLDAVEMGSRPGTVAIIGADRVRGSRLSTHAMPLSVIIEYLEGTTSARANLLGLQPDLRARSDGPTPAEEAGLTRLVATFQRIFSEPGERRARTKARSRTYGRYRTGEATK